MEVSGAVALLVAVALMALGMAASGWLQRAEARREEVRRLAWQAAEEVEIAEREEAYCYGQYGGAFVPAPDVPEAPQLWTAPEVPPSPKAPEDDVAAPPAASPPAGKGVCAMCARPTTLRCKRCKSVKYCCYANAVLQSFLYFLGSKREWCFMCELEKVMTEGKHGTSPVSPTGILSHLNEIGTSFGQGREEDAHEFLRYAIDTMQSASMKEAKKNGVHKLAEETTLVQLIFGGYLQSKIKCTKCQVSSAQSERILDLTVEIDGDINTLEGALHRFTSSEVLDGDNRYHCSRCMSYERANKKLTISEAPNILTIALKRYKSGVFGKISKDVKFPEHLNLSQFMCETDDYSPVYSLYAVVVHHDVMNATNSGHYVCYVKDPQGKWHELDDSKVKPVSLKKVLSKCAYMLLYARCAPRAPDSVRKAMLDQGESPLGRGSFVSVQQGEKSCKDHPVHNLTYTLDASGAWSLPVPGFVGSDSSSLFSSSDAGSSSTLSSESTDSTRNSEPMDYGHRHGASDHMRPVSTMVIPEEDELNCLRQRSSVNPSTSGHDMDQAGEFARQYHHKLQVGRGVLDKSGETPPFSTDQGKHQGSSSSRNRSSSRNCKLTEQRTYTGAAFFLEGQLGRGLSKHFTGRGGLGL
nr:unnamed protein product [Digitaria exilis]